MVLTSQSEQLLALPTFKPSAPALADLKSGNVDTRLVFVLLTLAQQHALDISTIKTGHPMEPKTRGGFVNSHYYYRAVDIIAIDGKSIAGHETDPDIVDVGRILRSLSPQDRPDHIFGPAAWHATLRYTSTAGFKNDPFHNQIYADHLHLSFELETGTDNQE
ncbi:hypothetical protein KDW_39700 [Dictyobacter vulcani]|uniref:Uncharacterized protein n=1 Tax=Dictyobacter vulcani TaxID=2607529 RepID=A0A5J4KJB5_9CHLR|nr:hypothetical protein [Dictyobacter vulcani]GER89808.1 hypothetical protein KDW_39700 [Dictyobacter vulcani]